MEQKYYTVEEISELINIHPKTIQRYIREGRLKAQKIGRRWQVTGHDLSVFVEGTDDTAKTDSSTGVQTIFEEAARTVKVSSVIDIPVKDTSQAASILNWLTAAVHSRERDGSYTTMSSQYIESERIVRVMLWGNLRFIQIIMDSLSELEREV